MRTFEQYIEEAYNFRLGGSQKKGFDQTKAKLFKELEKGDIIYWYNKTYDLDEAVEVLKLDSIDWLTQKRCILYTRNQVERGGRILTIEDDTLDKTSDIVDNYCTCIATNKEEFIETVRKEFNEDVEPTIKSFEQKISEAYNFRLGGSQNKGYEQNNAKTFAELGDNDYFFVIDLSENTDDEDHEIYCYRTLSTMWTSKAGGWKEYIKKHGSLDDVTFEEMDDDGKLSNYATTSLDEVLKEYRRFYHKDTKTILVENRRGFTLMSVEDLKKEINEAYSFRLGGSQNKGYDQVNNHKTFNELKRGDKFYLWADTGDEANECTLRVDPYTEDGDDRALYLEVEYNKHYVWLKDANDSYSYCDNGDIDGLWVVATSFEELYDVVEEKFREKIDKNKLEKE